MSMVRAQLKVRNVDGASVSALASAFSETEIRRHPPLMRQELWEALGRNRDVRTECMIMMYNTARAWRGDTRPAIAQRLDLLMEALAEADPLLSQLSEAQVSRFSDWSGPLRIGRSAIPARSGWLASVTLQGWARLTRAGRLALWLARLAGGGGVPWSRVAGGGGAQGDYFLASNQHLAHAPDAVRSRWYVERAAPPAAGRWGALLSQLDKPAFYEQLWTPRVMGIVGDAVRFTRPDSEVRAAFFLDEAERLTSPTGLAAALKAAARGPPSTTSALASVGEAQAMLVDPVARRGLLAMLQGKLDAFNPRSLLPASNASTAADDDQSARDSKLVLLDFMYESAMVKEAPQRQAPSWASLVPRVAGHLLDAWDSSNRMEYTYAATAFADSRRLTAAERAALQGVGLEVAPHAATRIEPPEPGAPEALALRCSFFKVPRSAVTGRVVNVEADLASQRGLCGPSRDRSAPRARVRVSSGAKGALLPDDGSVADGVTWGSSSDEAAGVHDVCDLEWEAEVLSAAAKPADFGEGVGQPVDDGGQASRDASWNRLRTVLSTFRVPAGDGQLACWNLDDVVDWMLARVADTTSPLSPEELRAAVSAKLAESQLRDVPAPLNALGVSRFTGEQVRQAFAQFVARDKLLQLSQFGGERMGALAMVAERLRVTAAAKLSALAAMRLATASAALAAPSPSGCCGTVGRALRCGWGACVAAASRAVAVVSHYHYLDIAHTALVALALGAVVKHAASDFTTQTVIGHATVDALRAASFAMVNASRADLVARGVSAMAALHPAACTDERPCDPVAEATKALVQQVGGQLWQMGPAAAALASDVAGRALVQGLVPDRDSGAPQLAVAEDWQAAAKDAEEPVLRAVQEATDAAGVRGFTSAARIASRVIDNTLTASFVSSAVGAALSLEDEEGRQARVAEVARQQRAIEEWWAVPPSAGLLKSAVLGPLHRVGSAAHLMANQLLNWSGAWTMFAARLLFNPTFSWVVRALRLAWVAANRAAREAPPADGSGAATTAAALLPLVHVTGKLLWLALGALLWAFSWSDVLSKVALNVDAVRGLLEWTRSWNGLLRDDKVAEALMTALQASSFDLHAFMLAVLTLPQNLVNLAEGAAAAVRAWSGVNATGAAARLRRGMRHPITSAVMKGVLIASLVPLATQTYFSTLEGVDHWRRGAGSSPVVRSVDTYVARSPQETFLRAVGRADNGNVVAALGAVRVPALAAALDATLPDADKPALPAKLSQPTPSGLTPFGTDPTLKRYTARNRTKEGVVTWSLTSPYPVCTVGAGPAEGSVAVTCPSVFVEADGTTWRVSVAGDAVVANRGDQQVVLQGVGADKAKGLEFADAFQALVPPGWSAVQERGARLTFTYDAAERLARSTSDSGGSWAVRRVGGDALLPLKADAVKKLDQLMRRTGEEIEQDLGDVCLVAVSYSSREGGYRFGKSTSASKMPPQCVDAVRAFVARAAALQRPSERKKVLKADDTEDEVVPAPLPVVGVFAVYQEANAKAAEDVTADAAKLQAPALASLASAGGKAAAPAFASALWDAAWGWIS